MYNNRTFSLSLQKTLNLPIRVALFDRKLSVKDLSLLMNKTAYKRENIFQRQCPLFFNVGAILPTYKA